jgi:hypothetical protein
MELVILCEDGNYVPDTIIDKAKEKLKNINRKQFNLSIEGCYSGQTNMVVYNLLLKPHENVSLKEECQKIENAYVSKKDGYIWIRIGKLYAYDVIDMRLKKIENKLL